MTDITKRLIDLAIEEDLGPGDVTTDAIVSKDISSSATIRAKQDLIIAGLKPAEMVFAKIDKSLAWERFCQDGDKIDKGAPIAKVSGPVASMLKAERTALNFLQHLSGIATYTNLFMNKISGTKAKVLDTRKTMPGHRELEKAAVRAGSGENHRMGLYDRYLIKNNHITAAGSITKALELIKANNTKGIPIEVEARDLKEVKEAVKSGADIVMLDNFSYKMVFDTVQKYSGKVKLEVSGNIDLSNALEYAKTGVDFISIGAITHSAPAADIHMIIG